MDFDVAVIGAGMVGTSTAVYLQQKGFKTALIDQKLPGSETSYGNASLIQREAVFLTPFPGSLHDIARILPNQSTDVRYRVDAMLHYAKPIWQYKQNSRPVSLHHIEEQWATLIEHCTEEHQKLIELAKAEDLIRRDGWIQLYRTPASYEIGKQKAEKAKRFGVESRLLTTEQIKAMEPNVNLSNYVGGIHWLNSWQVSNPGELVKRYAKYFTDKLEGIFLQESVQALTQQGDSWQVQGDKTTLTAKHVVVCMGPWSNKITAALGYKFPIIPIRGYHRHFKVTPQNQIKHSFMDADAGFVISPTDLGIRITTGAEMAMQDAPERLQQLDKVSEIAKQIVPLEEATPEPAWFGSRPCMSDMKPVLGPAPHHQGLWFAFGHGHQGFTLGPVTGRIMAELVNGETPFVDVAPFSPDRF
ncbi:NAD(P)/FAD-dependent oxidoreductase [Brackiella oedipodis]|uniref:NAD(P)/FAD-dependent oxidoreductase n=1 Tax=Brackiella oedipodis TaxID=124225 RepID=UPI00048AB012|nr:FAD-binding oxidoreductase [Brackiella oedipodis]